ncbi:MAG: spore germination protein, partial [Clostridiaceae bacterium]|nr:spore germination protein [Clostridiaceae bacterium]
MKKIKISPKSVKPMSTIKFRTKESADRNSVGSTDYFDSTAERFRKDLSGNADVIMRELFIGGNENIDALLVYLMGNIDKKLLNDCVIKPLMTCNSLEDATLKGERLKNHIIKKCLYTGSVSYEIDYEAAVQYIYASKGLLLVNGIAGFLILTIGGGQERQISEPETEKRIRGTREGFIEDIWVNIG